MDQTPNKDEDQDGPSDFEKFHEMTMAKKQKRNFDPERVYKPKVENNEEWEKFCQEMENLPSPKSEGGLED